MARKLKTYRTSLGFFEQAIAAPSMKAALEAWGADSNLFHQGAAKESHDPDVIAATMAKPGVVLKRPVGSDGPFGENAELPKHLGGDGRSRKSATKSSGRGAKETPVRPDKEADRKAAQAYERERQRREREEAKGGGQAEGARTQAGGHRQGSSGVGHRRGETHAMCGRPAFLRTVMCSPVRASTIAQVLRIPRATVLRRLYDMEKLGYVEHVGNACRMTDKANIPDMKQKLQKRIDMILKTAMELSNLNIAYSSFD